jgi:hypothetical protein
MTQEEKDLLFKDLCARLPFSVKLLVPSWDEREMEYVDRVDILYSVNGDGYIRTLSEDYDFDIEDVKPYLFPLSSMTEEQREELYKIGWYLDEDKIYSCFRNYDDENYKTHTDCFELINWCYKNNFDINGLIPMGLAIDATGLNVY